MIKSDNNAPLLQVRELKITFPTERGNLLAVDGISFDVNRGEIVGLVGESGCGKSVTAQSVMRLHPNQRAVRSGEILFESQNLLSMDIGKVRKLCGAEISMIFQDPMTALNPVMSVGDQVGEPYRVHYPHFPSAIVHARAIELLEQVGLPDPEARWRSFPHELSGGMRQRVMIAMALACRPKLLIADEPTTALDVTIQAQILDLIMDLRRQLGMAVLLITHDLGVVSEVSDQIVVMYSGAIVEQGATKDVLENPKHPYTQGLLRSMPLGLSGAKQERLKSISGQVPSPFSRPSGCRFRDRCDIATEKCSQSEPILQLMTSSPERKVACFEVK